MSQDPNDQQPFHDPWPVHPPRQAVSPAAEAPAGVDAAAAVMLAEAKIREISTRELAPALMDHAIALVREVHPTAERITVELRHFTTKGYADPIITGVFDPNGNALQPTEGSEKVICDAELLLRRYTWQFDTIHWEWDGADPEHRVIPLRPSTPPTSERPSSALAQAVHAGIDAFWAEATRSLPDISATPDPVPDRLLTRAAFYAALARLCGPGDPPPF